MFPPRLPRFPTPKALDTVTKDRRHALAASMRKAGANQLVTAEVFPSGSIKTLSVYLENKGMGGKMFTLNRTSPESDVAISSRPFRFRMHETLVSGKVQGAIDRSLSRAGLPAVVIRQVHAIFDRDRDPLWSMNKGDQFWVVSRCRLRQASCRGFAPGPQNIQLLLAQ